MLKNLMLIFFTVSVSSTCSVAAFADTSLKGLSKDEFLRAYEDNMEKAWPAFSALYSRVNPELADLVPGKEWTEEDREASACIYDEMKQSGNLDSYITALDKLGVMRDKILENNDVTVLNMHEHPDIDNSNVAKVDGYLGAMNSCGYMALMQKRMQESGLWEKMMQSAKP